MELLHIQALQVRGRLVLVLSDVRRLSEDARIPTVSSCHTSAHCICLGHVTEPSHGQTTAIVTDDLHLHLHLHLHPPLAMTSRFGLEGFQVTR